MINIKWSHVSPTDVFNRFCCEASDIGLQPGEWPVYIPTSLGNRRDLVRQYADEHGSYLYQQESGQIEILIFND